MRAQVRSLVEKNTARQMLETATYWAEKAASLSQGDPSKDTAPLGEGGGRFPV